MDQDKVNSPDENKNASDEELSIINNTTESTEEETIAREKEESDGAVVDECISQDTLAAGIDEPFVEFKETPRDLTGDDGDKEALDEKAEDETTAKAEVQEASLKVEIPPRQPWWKRLFSRRAKKTQKGEVIPQEEALPAPSVPAVLPEAPLPAAVTPEALPPAAPVSEGAPPLAQAAWGEPPLVQMAAAPAPAFTFDDVRSLIEEEIVRSQADITRAVQAEVVRQQQDRDRALYELVQDVAEGAYKSKAETFRLEMEALREEERLTLKNHSRPLRERMEEVDFIRDHMTKLGQEIAELEKATAQRVAESAQLLAELEGRGVVTEFRQELERQKAAVVAVPEMVQQAMESRLSEFKPEKGGGLGLWPSLLGLLLVIAVGMAGVLLPRQAEPGARFLVEMASLYQTTGNPEDTIRVLDEAVGKGISDAETLGHVGKMYRLLNQFDKAIAVLGRALAKEPNNETYRLSLARSYAGAGKQTEAIAEYQALIGINPASTTYYLEMGLSYRSLKNYDQALAQYQKTLEIDPSYWQGYYYQGEVYREQQRYDKAAAQYQKSLEIYPTNYWTQLWCGVSYAGLNDWRRAIEHYQAAMAIDPEQAETYYYLGEAYRAQGQFDQALQLYQQTIEKNHQYTAAYVSQGKAYASLDDCPNAMLQFSKALKWDPNNAEAKEGLAACAVIKQP